jgi:hypothetical protein
MLARLRIIGGVFLLLSSAVVASQGNWLRAVFSLVLGLGFLIQPVLGLVNRRRQAAEED